MLMRKKTVNNDVSKDSPIDNNKSAFVSTILLLPEFHCSRKLISIVSRPRPLPASRLSLSYLECLSMLDSHKAVEKRLSLL